MARILLPLALLVAFVSCVHAQEHKGVLFTQPAGWEKSAEGDAVVLTPKDLKEGELLAILITPALPASSDPPLAQFEATVAGANEGDQARAATEPTVTSAAGRTIAMQVFETESEGLGKHKRLYVMAFADGQSVLMIVIANKGELMDKRMDTIADVIASLKFKKTRTAIPTGDTPDLFMGMVGWLPSGKGVPIPSAAVTGGKPVGLWWKAQVNNQGLLAPVVHMYTAEGVRASLPRLGGGRLFDVEGQRKQRGTTGVGTFSIANGTMTEKYGAFENSGAFASGSDKDGKFFKLGGAMFRPLIELTEANVVGSWRASSSELSFRADGTYESGSVLSTGDWAAGSFTSGTYVIDGFLLMLVPKDGPITISLAGMGGLMLVRGGTFYTRK